MKNYKFLINLINLNNNQISNDSINELDIGNSLGQLEQLVIRLIKPEVF